MDAYPQDDSALDAMHPFEREDRDTEDVIAQRDYDGLVALLRQSPFLRWFGEGGVGALPIDEREAVRTYAEMYGWRQAIRVIYECLPAKVA